MLGWSRRDKKCGVPAETKYGRGNNNRRHQQEHGKSTTDRQHASSLKVSESLPANVSIAAICLHLLYTSLVHASFLCVYP